MKDHNNPPKWKKFEAFVANIQEYLTPHAKVTQNEFITGKSGVKRQNDVVVRYNLGQFNMLIVIDCKDWRNSVDIGDVGSFADLVEDVGANKGAIVCNAGFTSGALKRAREKGIELLKVADVESKDWPVKLAIPVLCDFRYIEYTSYGVSHTGPTPFMIPGTDPEYLEIYKSDGNLIDMITNLIKKAWNENKFPDEPGEHRDLKFVEEDAYFKVDDVLYGPAEITANIIVKQELYFGELPIDEAKGFHNEATGGFITRSFKTTKFDIGYIQKKWRLIDSKAEIAIEPVMTMYMSDFYPLLQGNKEADSN